MPYRFNVERISIRLRFIQTTAAMLPGATRKDYALSIATPLPPRNNATKVTIGYFRFLRAEWNTRQAVGYFRSRVPTNFAEHVQMVAGGWVPARHSCPSRGRKRSPGCGGGSRPAAVRTECVCAGRVGEAPHQTRHDRGPSRVFLPHDYGATGPESNRRFESRPDQLYLGPPFDTRCVGLRRSSDVRLLE
jgi:hypothetical protein